MLYITNRIIFESIVLLIYHLLPEPQNSLKQKTSLYKLIGTMQVDIFSSLKRKPIRDIEIIEAPGHLSGAMPVSF